VSVQGDINMHFAERAALQMDGVRLSIEMLQRVGIGPESQCWALWMPSWTRTHTNVDASHPKPGHLVISPFHPDDWPCLIHFTLKLHDATGTVHNAIKALAAERVNILSHSFTPTGHNHGTLDAVGTLSDLLGRKFLANWRAADSPPRTTDDVETQKILSRKWAPLVLDRLRRIVQHIYCADSTTHFLRPRFASDPKEQPDPTEVRGLAYHPYWLPARVKAFAETQHVNAVEVRWLQYPAFYWFYGCSDEPLQLQCNESGRLTVHARAKEHFRQGLGFSIPKGRHLAPALAYVDPETHFIRIMPYRISADDPYSVTVRHTLYSSGSSTRVDDRSRGLLQVFSKQLNDAGGADVWHMTNRIHHLRAPNDVTDITFIVTDRRVESFSSETGEEVPRLAQRLNECLSPKAITAALAGANFRHKRATLITQPPRIERIACNRVFVSTRFNWWQNRESASSRNSKRLKEQSARRAKEGKLARSHTKRVLRGLGYELEMTPPQHGPALPVIHQDVTTRIRSCAGLLQIVPAPIGLRTRDRKEHLEWMLFELGIARGANIPVQIVLQADNDDSFELRLAAYRTIGGVLVHRWTTASDLRDAIEQAINSLHAEISEPV
jgi:hypothetical protein